MPCKGQSYERTSSLPTANPEARSARAHPVSSDLTSRIEAVEARLVAREQRMRARWQELGSHVRETVRPRRLVLPVLGAVALLLVGRALSQRHSPAAAPRRRSGRPRIRWMRLFALALPFLPLEWRERLQPTSIASSAWHMIRASTARRSTPPAAAQVPPPITVDAVDLSRYAGTWHEIARLPTPYERACVSQPSATYTPGADGIVVTNRCLTRSGRMRVAQGLARVVPGSGGARLKVTFAPGWLRWLDAVWADYWILDLDADYQVALVGTPRRDALWLLARDTQLDAAQRDRLLGVAAAQGYDVQRVQFS